MEKKNKEHIQDLDGNVYEKGKKEDLFEPKRSVLLRRGSKIGMLDEAIDALKDTCKELQSFLDVVEKKDDDGK